MNSRDYWKRRSLNLEELLHTRAKGTVKQISGLYEKAQESVCGQIEKIFSTYARKGGALNEKKATELLTVKETQEARDALLEQYQTATGQVKRDIWARLSAPAYANRISRLQALRDDIYTQARRVGLDEVELVRDRLTDTLEQSYYRTTFDVQQYTGEGYRFDLLGDDQITAALAADWSGKNWSDRLWDNNQRFADAVEQTVTVGILAGLRYDEMRDNLLSVIGLDDTQGARYNARRLVVTECNYIANQGHLMGYQAAEIDRYIYLATLDLRTSEICRKLDGQRFPVSEAQAGTNLPPMHPHCRSTTMPDMSEGQLNRVNRAARDPVTGKSVTVPGDMTYREWYEKYVSGNPQAKANEKKIRNQSGDRKQFNRYRQVLGDDAPKTFAEFQDLKYNNSEAWGFYKLDYQRRRRLQENPELALPNAENATAADAKFSQYLFGGKNASGLSKGQAFSSRLGYDSKNWKELQSKIEGAAKQYPAVFKGNEGYGNRYEQRMILYGLKGNPANVVVGWIYKPDGTLSMTSAYIKEAN
ncbi:MAG: minor capsid protein [Clostridiales bacterium]|nr:minor capsid protein [Clostridiales bacterium]